MPSKNRGKTSAVFSSPFGYFREIPYQSCRSCKHDRWMITKISHNSFVIVFFRVCVKQTGHHRTAFIISNTKNARAGHSSMCLLLLLLTGKEALTCLEDQCLRLQYRPAPVHCLSERCFLVRMFKQSRLRRSFSVERGKSGWIDEQPSTVIPTGLRRI